MAGCPFQVVGNTVQVLRYSAKFQMDGVDANGNATSTETVNYFVTREGAERAGGTNIQPLDVSDCKWMDGMQVETFDEALAIYQAGKAAWWSGQVEAKCAELSEACHAAIVAGCDVVLEDGSRSNFSLAESDQINLTTALAAVEHGAAGYPYHADGQMCRVFSAADIQAIAQAATAHKLFCTTLCNHLMAWARRVETKEELAAITYQSPLPEDLAEHMQEVMQSASTL